MNGNKKLRHLSDLNKKLLLKYFCNIYYNVIIEVLYNIFKIIGRVKYEKIINNFIFNNFCFGFFRNKCKKVPYESMIKSDDGIIFVEGDSAPYTGIIEKKSDDGRVEATSV